jgi:hypothetical protein
MADAKVTLTYRIVCFAIVWQSSLDLSRLAPHVDDEIRRVASSSPEAFSDESIFFFG